MITFLIGLLILALGYVFYSSYVVKQFAPSDEPTPAHTKSDGIDFIPMGSIRNSLIQLLNIAGIGPLMGAVQGILFGPIAFILIPTGCIFMGAVHDYFAGMISLRNGGAQLTGLIKKYLGTGLYKIFILILGILLLLVSVVFVYTSGDLLAEKFFHVTDFSFSNPIILAIYGIILGYFIIATLFPIDKIIGKLYPIFGLLLLLGTFFILVGFFTHGVNLSNLDFHHINMHPSKIAIIPMFFMTVSCGMLSGFHATQSTIVSRTLNSERDGKKVFFDMMCLESVIAMIWAAGAMHVYSNGLVPPEFVGQSIVLNIISENFLPYYLTFIVTMAIVILPITSGDTALRSLRLSISEVLGWGKSSYKHNLMIIIPIAVIMLLILFLAKINTDAFFLLWRYFTFANSLLATITFMFATVYLFSKNKNYFITLIPCIFSLFVSVLFILNAKIGFNLSLHTSKIYAVILSAIIIFWLIKTMRNYKRNLSE